MSMIYTLIITRITNAWSANNLWFTTQRMQLMENSPILVIGKHGKTGSRVNKRLQTLGYPTRAVSRSTTPSFDWELPGTWQPAIEGTLSAYVSYQPDLAFAISCSNSPVRAR